MEDYLKTLGEITEFTFKIPNYQRGYRWREANVKALLNDLYEFFSSNPTDDQYYLLQPIIVKKKDDTYELVDGQQRLTTMYLILKHLGLKSGFKIEYETRTDSRKFLENICGQKNNNGTDENPDYYYMSGACKTIKDWFEDENEGTKRKNLFTKENLLTKVKFIWYEPEGNLKEAFLRINTGRNPLTSPELIRSEFLYRIKHSHKNQEKLELEKQIQIKEDWKIEIDAKEVVESRIKSIKEVGLEQRNFAMEWDEVEKLFKNDDFWYFLTNEEERLNRLEFAFTEFFNLKKKGEKISKNERKSQQGYVYNKFKEYLKNEDYQKVWNEFKDFVYTLYDWYSDKEIYHLIGFLLWRGEKSISNLIKLANKKNKEDFRKELKYKIKEQLKEKLTKELIKEVKERNQGEKKETQINDDLQNDHLKELFKEVDYEYNYESALFILFLHNLIKYHNEPNNIRFPFKKFKEVSGWSIEHIFARNSRNVEDELKKEQDIDTIIENLNQYFDRKLKELGKFYCNLHENERCEEIKIKLNINEAEKELEITDWEWESLFKQIEIQDKDKKNEIKVKEQIIKSIEGGLEKNFNIDDLENLALLPTNLNSKLNNKVFWEKRQEVIAQFTNPENSNYFVPLATFMVFNKLYSKENTNDFYAWYKSDAEAYFDDIVNSISGFLNLKTENNEKQQ